MSRATLPRAVCICIAIILLAVAPPADAKLRPRQQIALELDAVRLRLKGSGATFTVGYNPAMDYSLDRLCGLRPPKNPPEGGPNKLLGAEPMSLPSSFDWRGVATLPPVRNQGACGSCWAFATVGPLECSIAIQEGTITDLSEQWLLSCNTEGWDCDGGWWAHDYHIDPGAVLETGFPYVAHEAPCAPPYDHLYRIASWAYADASNSITPTALIKQAIYNYGPVCVAIRTSGEFHAYTGGIFNTDDTGEVNHGVVLVGWDDDQGADGVWYLRNSWGPGWGEGGYMRIEYGVSQVGYATAYVDYHGVTSLGTVELDRDAYTSPAVVRIEVADADLDLDPDAPDTVIVDIASDTEPSPESVTCTETADGTKRFIGSITLATGFSSPDGLLQAVAGDTITVTYHDADHGGSPLDVTDSAQVVAVLHSFPMDSDPGWTTTGDWAFGFPTGGGGEHGSPDPFGAHTGDNVYGYNLAGDYPNDISTTYHLTTGPLDLTGSTEVALQFRRWLGVEQPAYDHANLQVSDDGSNWTTVWTNPTTIADDEWTLVTYDLSSVADDEPNVYIRWGMGSTDVGWRYCGWNIDDVEILGVPSATLAGSVQFGSRSDHGENVMIRMKNVATQLLREEIVHTDQDGGFTIQNVAPGTYDMTAEASCYLRQRVDGVLVTGTGGSVDFGIALGADQNGDGSVDYADLPSISAAFGTTPGDPGYSPCADLNRDGAVDFGDLPSVTASFGRSSAPALD